MTGKVYLKGKSFELANIAKGQYHGDRCDAVGEDTDGFEELDNLKQGFFFRKNLFIDKLPEDTIALEVTDVAKLNFDLMLPVFERAPNLPDKYKESIRYWSEYANPEYNAHRYQNSVHEYFVGAFDNVATEELVSEGLVVLFENIADKLVDVPISKDSFIKIKVPFAAHMLIDMDSEMYCGSTHELKGVEDIDVDFEFTIYLKYSDIINAPNPNSLYIDLIHFLSLDYGYCY